MQRAAIQPLGHDDEVAGELTALDVGERARALLDVSEFPVKGRQLRSDVHHFDFYDAATVAKAPGFGF